MTVKTEPLPKVREVCLSFPDTNERLSHGVPTFFIRDKHSFVMYLDNHHDDGRLALWCAAAPGMQAMLVDGDPNVYFVPPYVGHSGWVGVRLDRRARWADVAGVIEQAYLHRMARLPTPRPPRAPTTAARRRQRTKV